ncbi:hypothetical protein CIK05_04530 [Bdellovibrio sp. qaytius]|nr:hypothetical protein CIK05_04530 [Bdellovibrio sp. qaytius]
MNKYFVFFISTISFTFSLNTLACDCMGFANAQQAAQKKNIIIAKVETITLNNGKARVRIEKVLKGEIDNVYLDIQGQDGANCNGENIPTNQKGILLFEKSTEGYRTLTCASTQIPQNSAGLYQINLGEDFLLTENEIKDVLDYKLQASVISVDCQISVNRMAVPYDSSAEMNFQYDTAVSAIPIRDEVTTLKTTVDLAPLAPKVNELFFFAEVKKAEPTKYDFNIRMKDPFTGVVLDRFNYQLDLRKSLQFNGPSLSRFTDLNGNPMTDSNQPFLSHQTRSFCALNVGHPLELVK